MSLPGEVMIRRTAAEALDSLAADLLAQALTCVRTFGDFHLAVGGDATMELVYMRLMTDPELRAFPWRDTHLWLTHEHEVDDDHPRLVFASVRDFLVDHSDIPAAHIHRPAMSESAPIEYERELRAHLSRRDRGHDRLDGAILSVEPQGDAGGRSLTQAAAEESRWCAWLEPAQSPRTLALTRTFLNATRMIGLLAVGEERSQAVAAINHAAGSLSINPLAGELRWYFDDAAVGYE